MDASHLEAEDRLGSWELQGVSPSVRSVLSRLPESCTAALIVGELLRTHPEYGEKRGGRIADRLDPDRGEVAPVWQWLARVRDSLTEPGSIVVHGKLLIVALARLDESLREQLSVDGWLSILESELDESVEALFEAPPAPTAAKPAGQADEVMSLRASAAPDLPSARDALGFTPLVTALRALLDDPDTQLPLAIAVTGKWGAGKSSVMRQLERQLQQPPEGTVPYRRWTTVRFDAWKYERSERLWAALAKAVYDQTLAQKGWLGRLGFRIRLEWARLPAWRFFLRFLWPALVAGAAVLGLLAADLSAEGVAATATATTAAIGAGVARYWNAIVDPFKAALDRHSARPRYEEHLGFTSEADHDIACLTQAVAPTDGDALAVLVDDLDRCNSAHLVEVVEAMNQIFNSDERQRAPEASTRSGHRCVFVLGLDREIVSTMIEVAYRPTIQRLRALKSPLAGEFGMQFLAKLVQISVPVPRPRPRTLVRLIEELTARGDAYETLAGFAAERVARAQGAEEVARAELASLQHLDANPRQVKRFHNAFRLQVYVAAAERGEFDPDQLLALGRWVALRLRWPALADDLDEEPELLPMLEAAAQNEEIPPLAPALIPYEDWFHNERVKDVLRVTRDADKVRVSALPLGEFLAVA